MQSKTVQRVTEDKAIGTDAVIQLSNAELIARTEKALLRGVPDRKSKISEQVFNAVVCPRCVSVQDQLRIVGCSRSIVECAHGRAEFVFQPGDQFTTRIEPDVCGKPELLIES